MHPHIRYFLTVLLIVFPLQVSAADIPLNDAYFEHIQFKRIKPSQYSYSDDVLKAEVDAGASILMHSFDTVQQVSQINFLWRSTGMPKIADDEQEARKDGDDAVLKIGLLLRADEKSFNPFLPAWMKRVDALLKFPSENMIYLIVDARHVVGAEWDNPYNKRVKMVSVGSVGNGDGWQRASHSFAQPVSVVAMWVMADGDNTQSQFTSYLKDIQLQ